MIPPEGTLNEAETREQIDQALISAGCAIHITCRKTPGAPQILHLPSNMTQYQVNTVCYAAFPRLNILRIGHTE